MTRRIISLLLSLCLLCACLPAFAQAASVTVTTDMNTEFGSIELLASAGGTLYTLDTADTLCAIDPQTRESTVLGTVHNSLNETDAATVQANMGEATAAASLLLSDGAKLYGLCIADGTLYALTDEAGAFAPSIAVENLDTIAFLDDDGMPYSVMSACLTDGTLYATLVNNNDGRAFPLAIDLQTGDCKMFTTTNLWEVSPYKDGLLLARQYDLAAMYTSAGEISKTAYGTFDPAKDTFTKLGELGEGILGGYSVSGLCYAADEDCAYATTGSKVIRIDLQTGDTVACAYTGEGMYGSSNGVSCYVQGGSYARLSDGEAQILHLDPNISNGGVLRIFGEFGTEPHKTFAKNYPDIPTEVAEDYSLDIDSLTSAMLSGSNAYDVLEMQLSYMPVKRLVAKGYCLDLTDYPEVTDRLAKLDPRFAQSVTADGRVYGVPVGVNAYTYAINMDVWAELGLTEDDIPTSLVGWYDFIANYLYDYGEDNPDVKLFDYGMENAQTLLFSMLFDQYITYCQVNYGGMTFDTDAFRAALSAYEAIDFNELVQAYPDDAAYSYGESLFMVQFPVATFGMSQLSMYRAMPLAFTDADAPLISANLMVMTINPKSRHIDNAIKYLCNYLDNLTDATRIAMTPEDNTPCESKLYLQNKAELDRDIAEAESRLQTADDEHKADVRAQLEALQSSAEQLEKERYSVSEEDIATFRDVTSPLLAVCQQSSLYAADDQTRGDLNTLLMQYIGGTVDQAQLIRELQNRVRMMELEDQ